jgi:hypothetical protein
LGKPPDRMAWVERNGDAIHQWSVHGLPSQGCGPVLPGHEVVNLRLGPCSDPLQTRVVILFQTIFEGTFFCEKQASNDRQTPFRGVCVHSPIPPGAAGRPGWVPGSAA